MGRPCLKVNNGDIFGMFQVIDDNPIIKDGHSYVKVKCLYCQTELIKAISDLKRRNATACKNCMGLRKTIPINIGDVYGHWTVISGPNKKVHKNNVAYKCRCSCGNESFISSWDLRSRRSTCCNKCKGTKSGELLTYQNGRVGDLCANQFGKIRKSAEIRGLDFNVSISYLWNLFINQNKRCAITGDEISSIKQASLDRINSEYGYIEGNVQWVTKQANLSKHLMSMEQLYEFCRKVLNHANQQPSQT